MKGYIKPLVTSAMLLVFATDGATESRSVKHKDNKPGLAGTRIKLRVVIPEVLLFRSADTTTSLDTLTFPTSVTTQTSNGSLVLHGNSGPYDIADNSGTATGTTYTASSL